MSFYLFARNVVLVERRFDSRSAKVVVHEWNPFETLGKLGVRVFEMPEHVLFEKKVGDELRPVYMHEVGSIALAQVKDSQILNVFNGQHLDRIQFLTVDQVKGLQRVFTNQEK